MNPLGMISRALRRLAHRAAILLILGFPAVTLAAAGDGFDWSSLGEAGRDPQPADRDVRQLPFPSFCYVETLYGGVGAADLDLRPFSHVIEAFVLPDAWGGLDPANGIPRREILDVAHGAGRRVLVSVGGGTVPGSVFSSIAGDEWKRGRFVRNICDFAASAGYDGIDLDWESPSTAERGIYVALVRALREELDGGTWRAYDGGKPILTAGVTPGYWIGGFDFAALDTLIDYAIYFGYDFCNPALGPWMHWEEMWPEGYDSAIEASVSNVTTEIVRGGLRREKLIVALPFFSSKGRPWIDVRAEALGSDALLHPFYLEKDLDGEWVTDPEALEAKARSVLYGRDIWGGSAGGLACWQIGHQGPYRELTAALLRVLEPSR